MVKQMNQQLFDMLASSAGMYIPLYEDKGSQQNLRNEYGTPGAAFPSYLKKEGTYLPKQQVQKERVN